MGVCGDVKERSHFTHFSDHSLLWENKHPNSNTIYITAHVIEYNSINIHCNTI